MVHQQITEILLVINSGLLHETLFLRVSGNDYNLTDPSLLCILSLIGSMMSRKMDKEQTRRQLINHLKFYLCMKNCFPKIFL